MSTQEPPSATDPTGPTHAASTPSQSYEFNDLENSVINQAATWAMVLAILAFISALSSLPPLNRFGIFLHIANGFLFLSISRAFKGITTSEGNDVSHLMTALGKLRVVLGLRLTALVVSVLFGFLLLVND
jgi:hypothetical protein